MRHSAASPALTQHTPAKIISVQSVCAGAGRSAIAANLAFELAAGGTRVLLIDLDENWPSIHRQFGLPNQQAAVLAALRLYEQEKLDANAFEELSVRLIARGVSIDFLSGYGLNLNRDAINYSGLSQLIRTFSERFGAIVIDAPAGIQSKMLSSIAAVATSVLQVTQADAVSLGRFLDSQPGLGVSPSASIPNQLVVNRLRASVLGARPEWQVQQVLRERTNYTNATVIPEDSAFDEALQRGLPLRQLGGKSKAATALTELAARLR